MGGGSMILKWSTQRIAGSTAQPRNRGSTLVLVMVSMVILSGVIMASVHLFKTRDQVIEGELHYHGQAINAAKAGLIDVLSWFRRQTVQPVAAFAPIRDLSVNPTINETDDPDIGIVREYQISTKDNLWERYEVRIGRQLVDGDGKSYWVGVHDVTCAHTDQIGSGSVGRNWYVEAKGYIFERLPPSADNNFKTYTPDLFYSIYETADGVQRVKDGAGNLMYQNVPTNNQLEEKADTTLVKVLASATVASEFRRLSVELPGNAAFCAARGDRVSLGNRSRIYGGAGAGLIYPDGTGNHWEHSGADLSSFDKADPADYTPKLDMNYVFKVTPEELQILSDIYTDDYLTLPDQLPDYSLVYIDGDATFTDIKPLRGTAIVYCSGDVCIDANSSSFFTGILYVEGDYDQNAPSSINGTVIVKGNLGIQGMGDYSEATYDPDARQRILQITGQYRFSAPLFFRQ